MRFAFARIVQDMASIVTWHHLAMVLSVATTKRSANSLEEVQNGARLKSFAGHIQNYWANVFNGGLRPSRSSLFFRYLRLCYT